MSAPVVIQFGSGASAAALIAGLPAAARMVHEVALSGASECWLDIATDRPLPLSVVEEVARLAGPMHVHWSPTRSESVSPLVITGEALVDAASIRAALSSGESRSPALRFGGSAGASGLGARFAPQPYAPRYAAVGRAIVKATAKPTDGLVSRSINRPISQAISSTLMHIPGIRPIHATMGTAALAIAMFAALVLLHSPAGLMAGAVLFQAASVFDGVDGEIARATWRTSDRGAMIDTLIDAATNLSFVAGIVINLAQRGRWAPALFGIAGLAMLALGLTALGSYSRRTGGPLTFDGLKGRFRDSGSPWGKWLVWLTMRDFIALASFVLVIAGLTEQAVIGFAAIMAVWLAVVLTSTVRHSAVRG